MRALQKDDVLNFQPGKGLRAIRYVKEIKGQYAILNNGVAVHIEELSVPNSPYSLHNVTLNP